MFSSPWVHPEGLCWKAAVCNARVGSPGGGFNGICLTACFPWIPPHTLFISCCQHPQDGLGGFLVHDSWTGCWPVLQGPVCTSPQTYNLCLCAHIIHLSNGLIYLCVWYYSLVFPKEKQIQLFGERKRNHLL